MTKLWGFLMKYKYLILFCIVMILSISAVSAADNTTEDIQTDDASMDFADLQTLIDEDTSNYVNFTGNYLGDANNNSIVINKDITLDGNGFSIDYLSNKPMFKIQATNVIFKNMTIIRHNNCSYIYNVSSFENVNFINKNDIPADLSDLQTLIDESPGNYITLKNDFVGDANNNTVVINKNITIEGNGQAIEYMGRNTMIDVQSGNVLFKNMVIVRHSKTSFIKGGLFENVTFIFKNDNPADLTDMQNLINEETSDTFTLLNDYVGDFNNKTVVIDKNITIDGNGFSVDYLSNKPIFYIQATNITIKNLNMLRHNTALGQKTVFTGDIREYNPMVENCTFIFDNDLPTIFANNLTKNYKNSTQFYATIVDANNQTLANTTVTFYVNGVYYNRTTDSEGRAKLNINLSPGKYIITSTNTVTNESRQNIIEVRFGNSIIADNLYKLCKDDSRPFYATALDYDGNPLANVTITFYVNGVYYNRTTDSDGRAKLNINLPPGEYSIISTNTFTGQSTSNLIRVMSPFVEANDLVKKYNTDTQFKVQLMLNWGRGQTVSFYINGVSYNRTADMNYCVAALNINLMPGQYIIASTTNNYTIYNTITVLEN